MPTTTHIPPIPADAIRVAFPAPRSHASRHAADLREYHAGLFEQAAADFLAVGMLSAALNNIMLADLALREAAAIRWAAASFGGSPSPPAQSPTSL